MSQEYMNFIARMKKKLGIDLSLYKKPQMKRRIISLRNKRGYTDFSLYFKALDNDEALLKEFVDRLTINISEFYRNPKRWNVLRNSIIPGLIKNKNKLTIWSAACSTGEEPYSIAMMLKEYFPDISADILATDIDEGVLEKAKEGIYQGKALKDLPLLLKDKYFNEVHGLYHVDQSIKRTITFKKHNLLADRYPANADLIICRNVLIYFTDEAKNAIYRNFSSILTLDGILFVGSTEQIFNPNQYGMALLDTFFYQKNSTKDG